MRFLNVMALLCLFTITGCNPEFTEQDVKENGQLLETVSSKSLDQFVQIRVQPTAKPEKYMVYFSWPRIEDGKFVRVRLDKTLIVVNPSQTDFNHEVFHNQTLTYTFEVLDNASKIEKTFPKQIKIPRDYVVRAGQSTFTEDTRLTVNRIFFTNEVSLSTNGFNVEFIVNELHSKDGIIETFPENAKAPTNNDGKSGGILKINAQLATGDLKIFMRGQHGGNGTQGEPYPSRAADGSPAGEGIRFCDCVGKHCLVLANNNLEIFSDVEPTGMVCTCESTGGNGGNGSDGAKGRKGHRAGNGGNAGELKVSIQDGREFDLQTYSAKGTAGIPGEGGEGQDGGIGGQRPDTVAGRKCGGNPGSNGSKGPIGDRGDLGTNGNDGLLCVYIASENKNDCYQ